MKISLYGNILKKILCTHSIFEKKDLNLGHNILKNNL
jgi:hypothetical protein